MFVVFKFVNLSSAENYECPTQVLLITISIYYELLVMSNLSSTIASVAQEPSYDGVRTIFLEKYSCKSLKNYI